MLHLVKYLFVMAGLLVACSTSPPLSVVCCQTHETQLNSSLRHSLQLAQQFFPDLKRIYQADVGRGKYTPAAFLVQIHSPPADAFRTQASTNGAAAKTKSAVQAFRVFLINSATVPVPGALAVAHGPFTIASNLSGNTQVITFTNVFTGNFYVGVAAFNSTTTFNSTTNITNLSASYTYNTEGQCYISTSGGEASFPGRVTVGAATAYVVTGTPQLQVNITLKDAVGATIDTLINVTNGG